MTQVSSLYIHVPFCQHLCNYCDFYKKKIDPTLNQFEEYHSFLKASLERQDKLFLEHNIQWSPLETVYLGGGTPSLWGPQGASFFQNMLQGLAIKTDAEFTMEIDPGTWTEELLTAWKRTGLNRISIGSQTLDPKFLKIMDRVHSLDETHIFLEKMKQENWNFSLDFLLGIPYSQEKKRNIQEELDQLLRYNPKHISLYILNARSKYPLVEKIPDEEYIREEYLLVSTYLQEHGFHHYEVSNFSLPGYEAQHNQKYWQTESVAALGPTGTGYLHLGEKHAIRYKWKVSKAEIEIEDLKEDELSLERTYLNLRTSRGWTPSELTPEIEGIFEKWQKKGYGKYLDGRMVLNSLGFLMLDSLMDDLFRL